MSNSLTPQSLKRKLQSRSESSNSEESVTNELRDLNSHSRESSEIFLSLSSPLEAVRKTPSPLRISQSSSPTRSVKSSANKIVHPITAQHPSSPQIPSMAPLQISELHKLFDKRPCPFPLELLKPLILAEFILKQRSLERYFQRRYDEINSTNMDVGMRSLQRPFVRSSPPSVPLSVYLERLFRYCHPEPLHILAIVSYSERLIKLHGQYVPPAAWHRFIVAAWMVAGKALLGDQYWTNSYWARVAGISILEICALENELIILLNWRLQVPINELTASWYLIQL